MRSLKYSRRKALSNPLIHLLVLMLVLIGITPLKANENGLRSYFTRYAPINGLSQGTIQDVFQDKHGFIWAGTQDGLNRFDGKKFTVYRHEKNNPNSLSNSFVRDIFQDSNDYLWIATDDGLNRLDVKTKLIQRYYFSTVEHGNSVKAITEDNKGTLWVGTKGGLFTKKADSNNFVYQQFSVDNAPEKSNIVKSLFKDSRGNIWVGTMGGLRRYDNQKYSLTFFATNTNTNTNNTTNTTTDNGSSKDTSPNSISHNHIRAISEDLNGMIWVGTYDGLNRYNINNETWQHYFADALNNRPVLSHNTVYSLQFSQQTLWIGTETGLDALNINTNQIRHFYHHPYDLHSLSNNKILSLIADSDDNIWVGTRIGLNQLKPKSMAFNHYAKKPSSNKSISFQEVSRFLKDQDNNVWVGTWGGGLNFYDHKSEQFEHYTHDPKDPNSIADDKITAIYQNSSQQIWVGTFGGGISIFNPKDKNFTQLQPSNENKLSTQNVTGIIEQGQGIYWISTFGSGLGLYDSQTNTIEYFTHDINNINTPSGDQIITILADQKGRLWIGTWNDGLSLFDPVKRQFRHFKHAASDNQSLSNNTINALYIDSQQQLWIGTSHGLNRFDSTREKFTLFDTSNGLFKNAILGLTGDAHNNIWISSNYGLTRFETHRQRFSHYGVIDGVQGLEFKQNGAYRSADDEIFIGGVNGFNRFYSQHTDKPQRPIVINLTELLSNNLEVPISAQSPDDGQLTIPSDVNQLDHLYLDYTHTTLTLKFAPQTTENTEFIRYRYRLDGLHKNWITTENDNRQISLSNIPAGNYQLQINATDHYGQWQSQIRKLDITMTPPIWSSLLAKILYLLTGFALLNRSFKRLKVKRIRLLAEQQQKIDDQRKLNQELQKIDRLKDEFLANTSHELRTPLNGIIGLTESLLDGIAGQLPEKANQNLAMVVNSGRRLNTLVNDILDFSKLDNQKLKLQCKPVDIKALVEVVVTLSKPLIKNSPLTLINDIEDDLPPVHADEDRIQQILYNLTGNAIKFTDSGKIKISAKLGDKTHDGQQFLSIHVIDSGIGITQTQQQSIFTSFSQGQEHTTRAQGGTGLGLSIAKQLVELHQGQLTVKSAPQKGSTFTFTLPISEVSSSSLSNTSKSSSSSTSSSFSSKEQSNNTQLNPIITSTTDSLIDIKLPQDVTQAQPNLTIREDAQNNPYRILIVDDEDTNLQVLQDLLSTKNYYLHSATSGQQALDIIQSNPPFDVVLLDIMMPNMSGYQVCRQIRENYDMEQLAVIFLTAKTQVKDLVDCFNAGGNDFISKPLNRPELLSRIDTHLRLVDSHRNLENMVDKRTRQLIQAEKLASLGTLTDGIAHEINNPTNFIHVGMQNLDIDIKKLRQQIFDLADEADQEVLAHIESYFNPLFIHLNTIEDGTNRIKTIVQSLQTFTHHGQQSISEEMMTDNLNATIELIKTKHAKEVEFVTNFVGQPKVFCEASALNQVFLHLINNACDAIIVKQQIPLEQSTPYNSLSEKLGKVIISCRLQQDFVHITITDNGCGMEQKTLKQISDPFFTTKPVGKGTGLGLAMVHGIITKHNGMLHFESIVNQGTTCTIKIPVDGIRK